MSYETIKFEKEAGFCIITLNRPERLNALNGRMWWELDSALKEIEKDGEIKVFIFTGAPRPDGRPCFCAGADLKEMAGAMAGATTVGESTPAPPASAAASFWARRRPRLATLSPTFENLAWSSKISIAAIDGVCTAGGIELALSCDIILAAETAQISDMHVKNLGWIGGAAAAPNMARRVGVSKAIQLCCTGDIIDGKEAYRIGLANEVYPSDKLMEGAKEMARKIGSMRLAALTITKAICRAVEDMDYASSWHYCEDAFDVLAGEKEAADFGPQRWVEKR